MQIKNIREHHFLAKANDGVEQCGVQSVFLANKHFPQDGGQLVDGRLGSGWLDGGRLGGGQLGSGRLGSGRLGVSFEVIYERVIWHL